MKRIALFCLVTCSLFAGVEGGYTAYAWKPFSVPSDGYDYGYSLDLRAGYDQMYVEGRVTHFKDAYTYNTAHAVVGRTIVGCLNLSGFAGLRYLNLREGEYRFKAPGPEVGLDAKTRSLLGFSGRARFLVAIPIGQKRVPDTPSETQALPFYSWEIGVRYTFALVSAGVGYRFDYIIDYKHDGSDIGFGGPYFTLRVGF